MGNGGARPRSGDAGYTELVEWLGRCNGAAQGREAVEGKAHWRGHSAVEADRGERG